MNWKRAFLLTAGTILSSGIGAHALADDPTPCPDDGRYPDYVVNSTKLYDYAVTLQRVRYEDSGGNWHDNANFHPEFDAVPDDDKEDTYIAVVNQPAKANVRHLVLMSAGQQLSGFESGVTGQQEGYAFSTGASATRYIAQSSLVRKLMKQMSVNSWFPTSETFIALAFDSQFDYDDDNNNLVTKINAFEAWLLSYAELENIETIYLAGASRGGALAYRLAYHLSERTDISAKVIVADFDAVLNPDMETASGTPTPEGLSDDCDGCEVYNPLEQGIFDWFGWDTDVDGYYTTQDNLRVYQVVGGAPVGEVLWEYHAYARESNAPNYFYRQDWVPYDHTTIGREMCDLDVIDVTIEAQLDWLNAVRQESADGTWKFSNGANSAWTHLNDKWAKVDQLLFADFDGDGETDVLWPTGNTTDGLKVAYSGEGSWDQIQTGSYTGFGRDQYGLGDFDADGKADIFYANGSSWWICFSNGRNQDCSWVRARTNVTKTIDELGFAELNHDAGTNATDVIWFSGSGFYWWRSNEDANRTQDAIFSGYYTLNTGSHTNHQKEAYGLADFNGNDNTDIFYPSGSTWYIATDGSGTMTSTVSSSTTMDVLGFGDFDGDGYDDVFHTTGKSWWWRESTGTGFNGWATRKSYGPHTYHKSSSYYGFGDFNDDGKTDVFFAQ